MNSDRTVKEHIDESLSLKLGLLATSQRIGRAT